MNQARSPFGQAVLEKYFSNIEIEVASAGVRAFAGTAYLPEVVGVSRRWGIDLANGFSRSLNEIDDLLDCNLVICAEEAMQGNVASLGFKGTVVSYEQVVTDPSFMPQDPAGLRGRYMESELAKVALVNILAVRDFLGIKTANPVIAVVPETESTVEAAIEWAVAESVRTGAILVDADLRAPLLVEFRKRGLKVGNFSQISAIETLDAFSSMTEQLKPEKMFLDSWWTKTIDTLALAKPVVMITAPQMINSGPLPDPYLAAIVATDIKVIRK